MLDMLFSSKFVVASSINTSLGALRSIAITINLPPSSATSA
jgi:hypothetical protein